MRLRRRASAFSGDSQTLWEAPTLPVATFVVAIRVVGILAVVDASTIASLVCLAESDRAELGFAGGFVDRSGPDEVGLHAKDDFSLFVHDELVFGGSGGAGLCGRCRS